MGIVYFNNNLTKRLTDYIKITKIGRSSNASNKITKLRSVLPFQYKFKPLILRLRNKSGRSSTTGQVTVFSKTSKKFINYKNINYNFRLNSLFFIGGLNYTDFSNKINTIVFSSNGVVSYVPSRCNDTFFFLLKLKKLSKKKDSLIKEICY